MIRASLQRRIAWLALCTIAFASAAPVLSHVIAAATGVRWVKVCSAAGLKRILFDAGSKNVPQDDGANGHCPFCRIHGQQSVVPSQHAFHMFFSDARSESPLVSVDLALRLFPDWPPSLSRAPPAHS